VLGLPVAEEEHARSAVASVGHTEAAAGLAQEAPPMPLLLPCEIAALAVTAWGSTAGRLAAPLTA
jgi:hypothetical protein